MLHPYSLAMQPRLCWLNAAQARAGTCSSSSPAPPLSNLPPRTEVFPTFGMGEENDAFFFLGLGVFFVFPQPLWSSPVYFFSSWLHALAKCFPVVFLLADLVELPGLFTMWLLYFDRCSDLGYIFLTFFPPLPYLIIHCSAANE